MFQAGETRREGLQGALVCGELMFEVVDMMKFVWYGEKWQD